MSATPPRPRHRRALPLVALALTAALTVALWGAAFWQLGRSAAATVTATQVTADVLSCPSAPIGPGCTARFVDGAGVEVTRAIDRPGLVGTTEGESVPVWIAGDGSIGVAGWRAWADAALFLLLAAVMTGTAVRWFAQVLRQGDEWTRFDLRDDDLGGHLRDVG